MMKQIQKFLQDEEGATAIEYALIAVLVALAMAIGATSLGKDLSDKFTSIGRSIVRTHS